MAFLAWHIIAILTVMAGSFLIGYSLGKKEDRKNYNYIDSTSFYRNHLKRNLCSLKRRIRM